MANNIHYWNIFSQTRISSTGATLTAKPSIAYGEYANWEIRVKTNTAGTVAAVDLSSCNTFSAAIDTDFAHTVIDGALTAGFSGAVTAITANGFTSTPPAAGVLTLTNGAGETESVSYSEWSLNAGTYTFTVSATLTYIYLTADDCDAENTAPCVRTLNASITSTNKATGILVVPLDANTATFLNAVGTYESVAGYFEVRGYNVSSQMIFFARFPVELINALDPSLTIPPGVASNYYTKAEGDARYALLTGAADIRITDSTKGLRLVDRTTATEYRIFIDNGAIGIESI